MSEIIFTDANFKKEVLESNSIPVLVDFWAPWCPPCKMLGPVIEELAKEFEGKVKIGKFNVQENQQIPAQYGIMAIPNMKIFKNGGIIDEIVGVVPKEMIVEKLNSVI